jgi:hypothetical protein
MSNELTAAPTGVSEILASLAPSKYGSSEDFAGLASSSSFLPRVMLMGANSTLVQEGKINQGHYGLVRAKDECEDLTREVACLPLSWRAKAMEISGSDITTVYDRKNPEFTRISEKSAIQNSGCMYGPEFLLWIPSAKCFATFYCSSKTSRREAPQIECRIGKPMLLKSNLIKGKKFNWFGPVATNCSVSFAVPSVEQITTEVSRFNNPPASDKEAAPEGAGDRER